MSYNLEIVDNYRAEYETNEKEMFGKYMQIVAEFCGQSEESINVKSLEYFKYVVIRGLETITHVYRMLLLYTRNVELSFYNCKKALYYYLEFIGQIGDEGHEFLKLTSTDAALFVYKKTVFSINHNHRKEYDEKDNIDQIITTDNLFTLTEIFLTCFRYIIENNVDDNKSQLGTCLKSIADYSATLVAYQEEGKQYNYKLKCLLKISDTLIPLAFVKQELFTIIARKIGRQDIDLNKISEAIISCKEEYSELTDRKYTNKIFDMCKLIA
jgi:hypothetical protein